MTLLLLSLPLSVSLSSSSVVPPTTIDVVIKFSESSLDPSFFKRGTGYPFEYAFGVNWYTCQDSQHNCKQNFCHDVPQCPGANAIFQNDYMVHNVNDKVGKDTWHKELLVDGGFTGEVSIDIFAPLPLTFGPDGVPGFTSSVTWCSTKWQNEMGGELCMANGNQWTVFVDGSGEPITLTIYPGFGMGVGETTEMFPAMYSPQLNNTRKVPVYVPPTLLQNKVPRPVNIMFILDGSQEVLEKFTTNGGFESAQIAGFVPESIMIGIQTVQFVLEGLPQTMGNQRGYELEYEVPLGDGPNDKNLSCIPGPAGGGTDLMLQWLDETVTPATLEKLGMTRGEISISGGSVAGLTSCYAASARPDFISRAACFSPSNCFNHGSDYVSRFSKKIPENFAKTGKLPKAVIQYEGAEIYGENQMKYMMQEDAAWQAVGMQPMPLGSGALVKHAADEKRFQPYDFYTAGPAPGHMIMSVIFPGGQHTPSTWMVEFHDALINLYRPSPADPNRKSRLDQNKYVSPKMAASPSASGGGGGGGADVTIAELDVRITEQNVASNAKMAAMEQKIDALTALVESLPPMIAECTAARRARAAANNHGEPRGGIFGIGGIVGTAGSVLGLAGLVVGGVLWKRSYDRKRRTSGSRYPAPERRGRTESAEPMMQRPDARAIRNAAYNSDA